MMPNDRVISKLTVEIKIDVDALTHIYNPINLMGHKSSGLSEIFIFQYLDADGTWEVFQEMKKRNIPVTDEVYRTVLSVSNFMSETSHGRWDFMQVTIVLLVLLCFPALINWVFSYKCPFIIFPQNLNDIFESINIQRYSKKMQSKYEPEKQYIQYTFELK